MSPAIGEVIFQRKYMVRVGFPVTGELAKLPQAIEVEIHGEVCRVIPLEDLPITLTYTKEKLKARRDLQQHDGEAATDEACERAIKVWKKKHADDDDYPVLIGFAARPLWERELTNTLLA